MSDQTVLLITARPGQLQDLAEEIRKAPGVRLVTAATSQEALDALHQAAPRLAIVDDRVGDVAALEMVRRLVMANAFIHTAVLSDAAEEAFHEASEGLGVLARLPLAPGKQDARRLLEMLRNVLP